MRSERQTPLISLILIRVDTIPAVNIMLSELRGSRLLLRLPGQREFIHTPGFRQNILRIIDPGWTLHLIRGTKPTHRGRAERRPLLKFLRIRRGERISKQFFSTISLKLVPIMHEFAQRNPEVLPLTDLLKIQ